MNASAYLQTLLCCFTIVGLASLIKSHPDVTNIGIGQSIWIGVTASEVPTKAVAFLRLWIRTLAIRYGLGAKIDRFITKVNAYTESIATFVWSRI